MHPAAVLPRARAGWRGSPCARGALEGLGALGRSWSHISALLCAAELRGEQLQGLGFLSHSSPARSHELKTGVRAPVRGCAKLREAEQQQRNNGETTGERRNMASSESAGSVAPPCLAAFSLDVLYGHASYIHELSCGQVGAHLYSRMCCAGKSSWVRSTRGWTLEVGWGGAGFCLEVRRAGRGPV